jgi:hypothetical protein
MTYANPDVLAVEFPTVLLMGPGALFCLYASLKRSSWKHVAIIIVSWCEIIGGWYTFAPVWLSEQFVPAYKTPLDTSSPWLFWVLLVFMNIVWVVIPVILMYDACVLSAAGKGASATPPSAAYNTYSLVALFLAAYATLVPTALLLAQK